MAEESAFNAALSEPLIEACAEGRLKEVSTLLKASADPNALVTEPGRQGMRKIYPLTATFRLFSKGDTLPRIIQRQCERIIETLLQAGARIRTVEREMLVHCVRMNNSEMLVFLVNHGARVQRFGHELMEVAILYHNLECAYQLKSLGIDPNIRDHWGSTTFLDICAGMLKLRPLQTELSPDELVQWLRARLGDLFDLGIQINSVDTIGATALMRAIVNRNDAMVRALLEEGASLQPIMRNGVNALHLAASCGSMEQFKKILRHVADKSQLERLGKLRLQPDIKAHLGSFLNQQIRPIEQVVA